MPQLPSCLIVRFIAMKINNKIFFAEVERLLTEDLTATILVRGNSMRPLLRDGRDKVVLRRSQESDIAIGEIMLFRYRGDCIMHRVVEINGDTVVFAGDGNYKTQEKVRRTDVIARVETVVRPSGRVVKCDSLRWRTMSRAWLILPRELRRIILGVMRRIN